MYGDGYFEFELGRAVASFDGNDLTVDVDGGIQISATSSVTLIPGSGKDVEVSAPYIVINGIRLYLATSAPSGNIPDNSIGIGW